MDDLHSSPAFKELKGTFDSRLYQFGVLLKNAKSDISQHEKVLNNVKNHLLELEGQFELLKKQNNIVRRL